MNTCLRNSSGEFGLIGEGIHGWLSSDQRGEVVAVVSDAIYLFTEENELFWLAPKKSPMHRRCLQLTSLIPRPAPGSSFEVRNKNLLMGSSYAVDFSCSPVWKAPVLPPGEAIELSQLPEIVYGFCNSLLNCYKPVGIGNLIPAILHKAGAKSQHPIVDLEDKYLVATWPAVEGIIMGCQINDFHLLREHAAGLVGLGEGLTPSGDDFLGGLFFSIHLLQKVYPEIHAIKYWPYSDFIMQCKPLTNPISFALLKDHADGHTLDPMHRLANALLAGQSPDSLLPVTRELISVGHSTGWSILTGFLAGMCLTLLDNNPSSPLI